jgi:hypothetical protein
MVKRTLFDSDGKSVGTVELEARYIPVPLKLEPRESVNSKQGVCLSSGVAKALFRSGRPPSSARRRWRDSWRGPRRYVVPFLNAAYPHVINSGKSDPYVVFTLDGEKVYKSQTKKKTLHPEWKETFSVTIVSVTTEYREPLTTNDGQYSRLVLQRTSSLKYLTGTRSRMPKAWGPPGSTSKKWNPSTV